MAVLHCSNCGRFYGTDRPGDFWCTPACREEERHRLRPSGSGRLPKSRARQTVRDGWQELADAGAQFRPWRRPL
jgi:hypothetical protein